MLLKKSRSLTILIIALILLLGFTLRVNNLYTWPRHGATFDEFAWTWQGINLIQKKVPVSWSSHPQYNERKHLIYQGAAFWIVKPYLEHPPFFGLVAGSFALLNGSKDMYHVSITNIRPLAVILGLLSIILIYLLSNQLFGKKVALISCFLYATIPTIVIGSRILQNENFFIPLWLLALLLVAKYLSNQKSYLRNIAAIICGLLILSKIPWIAAAISISFIFIYHKKYKDLIKFIIPVFLLSLLFVFYGFYYDYDLFIKLWGLQLNRYSIDFTSIFALFTKPYLVDRFFTDGWIYLGWFSFVLLLIKPVKKNIFIIFPIISYFLIFLAGIPDEAGHGWYRYPFYPFLVISLALFIKDYFNKNHIMTFLFLVFIGTSLFQNTWNLVFGFSYIVFRVIIITWSFSLLPIFFPIKKVNTLTTIVNYSWICIFFVLNIFSVLLYNEQ